jgi:hypothetical protein
MYDTRFASRRAEKPTLVGETRIFVMGSALSSDRNVGRNRESGGAVTSTSLHNGTVEARELLTFGARQLMEMHYWAIAIHRSQKTWKAQSTPRAER